MRFGIEKKGKRKMGGSEREREKERNSEGERGIHDGHETRSEGEGDSGANIPTD